MELIGRLVLDYPRAMYWSGQALLMVAMSMVLYFLGAGEGVMSALNGAGESGASASFLNSMSGALVLALIITAFWRAASLLPSVSRSSSAGSRSSPCFSPSFTPST
ncbi:hypothetical protein A33O_17844 [Nitratireductor aquibiodomus RA22]|uniref:Uncharacterized protein n=1 Tax=Nitratireductor aquibiodomus RA22 TaxID=1189611 RepID=I5BTL0_9HYPH|nr:hypothetical protein A33O_17844 [Nitratireductor aquibiodomus RA22]